MNTRRLSGARGWFVETERATLGRPGMGGRMRDWSQAVVLVLGLGAFVVVVAAGLAWVLGGR